MIAKSSWPLALAVLVLPLVLEAQEAPLHVLSVPDPPAQKMEGLGGVRPPIARALRSVDCDAGGSLADVLAFDILELRVEFQGTCFEDVTIDRDHTSLVSDGSGVIEGSLTVRGASKVKLEAFQVRNGRGLRIMDGSAVEVRNVASLDHFLGLGIRVEGSSTATLVDVTASNNLFANIAAIQNGNILLLGSVTANGASSTGLFVGGSSELDSRATSLTVDGNSFAGVFVQSGGSARFDTLSAADNGVVGLGLVGGGYVFTGGGSLDGHPYGVTLGGGSSAELNGLAVNGGGVSVLAGSSLRASDLVVTGAPNPDFGADVVVQSSHLLLLGGTINGGLQLAEGGEASFGETPVSLVGGLSCHPTAIAYAGQSCPP